MMKKTALYLSALMLAGSFASAAIIFTSESGTYDDSDLVITPTASVTSASNQIFLRDPRATLQTFQVGSNFELAEVNFIVRRALEGAAFTLTLRDFGTTAPDDSLSTTAVSDATSLASFSHTVTEAQAFGAAGPVSASDPYNTMTWDLGSTINLVDGNYYGLVFDGTNVTTGAPHIIHSYALGNPYAGGLGYYQDGNDNNFRTDVFGADNNQQADFSLALVAIPEPGTLALLGIAGVALAVTARRRK